jgi:hypothetical protein
MDKVRDVLSFVWKHRFWFGIGLAVILAISTYPTGTKAVSIRAEQKQKLHEGIFDKITKYTIGEHPNLDWKKAADDKNDMLARDVSAIWESLYLQQKELFTWPKEVAKEFGSLAFGEKLDFDRGQHLTRYRREGYATQLEDIWLQLDPLRIDENSGKLSGRIDAPRGVLRFRTWASDPTSEDAWLAQEELWIQREFFQAIGSINRTAKEWRDSPVRRLLTLEIGPAGLSAKSRIQGVSLVSAFGDQAATTSVSGGVQPTGRAATRGSATGGYPAVRYLAVTEQCRDVPIGLSLIVDQMRIPVVLAALSNLRLRFTIDQVQVGVPAQEVQLPRLIQDLELTRTSTKDAAIYGSLQMDVWGKVRIYRMPPSLKTQSTDAGVRAEATAGTTPAPPPAGAAGGSAPDNVAVKAEAKPIDSPAATNSAPTPTVSPESAATKKDSGTPKAQQEEKSDRTPADKPTAPAKGAS